MALRARLELCTDEGGMTSGPALMRASYAKTIVGGIKRRPREEQDRLLAKIGDARRKAIRGYGMLDWMPVAEFAEVVTVVMEAIGPTATKDFWRANLLLSLDRRLLSPLRLGAIAVYGNSPRSLLKMTPQAWELVSKNAGVCVTEDRTDGIVLRFDALPAELCVPGMAMLWSGGSESCIEKMAFKGHAKADMTNAAQGNVAIHVEWSPR